MDGLEVMFRLREIRIVPIILLTGRTLDQEKIRGLGMGADDYLAKPFNPDELIARIRAVLRRGYPPAEIPQRAIESGDVVIDLDKRMVKLRGEMVVLTRTEWLLLQFLASRAGRVVTNRELLTKIWGQEYSTDLQYLRVWISRLRTKLGENAANSTLIKTLPALGYMFTVHVTVPAELEAPVLV
jgi:two-component system KDP operon response regulator KdpE